MNQFDPVASGSPRGEPEVSGYPGSGQSTSAGDLAALLKLSGRGDEAAFAKLYDATAARAYGLAVRVVRDPSQAEEVAQEAFLEIWRTASRFDDSRGSAVSWILTLVHRKAVDRVRSVERAAARDQQHFEHETRAPEPDVSDLVIARDDGRRVRDALQRLPEVQRTALELAYFDGRSQREVAEYLEVPLGTVKTRIRDAMKRLRTYLREEPSV